MAFRSKIDLWLVAVLLATSVLPLVLIILALKQGANWVPHALTFVVLGASFVWLLLSTKYTVNQNALVVQSGPFTWHIERSGIKTVVPSRSVLSSPALSLHRLRIDYEGGKRSILVSPKDQHGFLNALAVKVNAA